MIPRLYVTDPLGDGLRVALDGDRTHYIKNVMRRAIGAEVGLFNGRDGEWLRPCGGYGKSSEGDVLGKTGAAPSRPFRTAASLSRRSTAHESISSRRRRPSLVSRSCGLSLPAGPSRCAS